MVSSSRGFMLRELLGDAFEERGEIDVLLRDALRVMGRQIDSDAVVDVRPLGMMIAFFDQRRGCRHETEGVSEIGKLVFAVELAVFQTPVGEVRQVGGDLTVTEFHQVHLRTRENSKFMTQSTELTDFVCGELSRAADPVRAVATAAYMK